MADLYSTLEDLINPRSDLGGAPGAAGDAQALAELIMGGGSAAVEGKPVLGSSFGQPTSNAPISSQFQQTLEAANALTGSMQPGQSRPDVSALISSLVGQPVNPQQIIRDIQAEQAGIRNPNYQPVDVNKAAAEAIQSATGERAAQLRSNAPIVQRFLQSMGVLPSEAQSAFSEAFGKAAGERAGGKGKSVISPELLKSAGTENFEELAAKAALSGNLDNATQLRLENLHNARLKMRAPEQKVVSGLVDIESSVKKMDDLRNAFEKTPLAKTGEISDALRLAMTRSTNWTAFLQGDLLPLDKLNKEEVEFAAHFNNMLIGMRRLYDDQRMSAQDMQFALQAIGNPLTGRDLYRKQMEVVSNSLKDKHNFTVDGLEMRGKTIKGLRRYGVAQDKQDRVSVIGPDGRTGTIPSSQLEEALRAGYKRR